MKIVRVLSFLFFLIFFYSPSSSAKNIIYQHTDMLGSVVAESNENGKILSRSHYQPFGNRIEGKKEGIGYTGHVHDDDMELIYMKARYYDPVIGRFYSNDPVGFTGEVDTFNRYSYVANNPYKYTDPTGEEKVSLGLSGEAMLVGGVRVGVLVGFDTETFELSGSLNIGPRLGLGLAIAPILSIENSGIKAVNQTTTSIEVNADAGVGPLSVSGVLVSEKTISGQQQVQANFAEPEGKSGVSASVGVDFKIEQQSTIIKDLFDAIQEAFGW